MKEYEVRIGSDASDIIKVKAKNKKEAIEQALKESNLDSPVFLEFL